MRILEFFIIITLLSYHSLFSQSADTTYVEFSGKVTNLETKEPVKASIIFESMPYANEMGTISSSSTDGSFSFYMRKNQKYSVRVKAEGFLAFTEIYDVASIAENGTIIQEIELKPGGVGQLITLEHLIFEQNKADITAASFDELDKLVIMLEETPSMEIQLEGHTHYIGNRSAQMVLSQQRVDAVKEYLTSKGISDDRVTTRAFGGTQPLTRENTPEAIARNRRVVVRVTKL